MSAPLICPIHSVAMAVLGSAIVQASVAHPEYAETLQGTIEKDDKNCNTRFCAMWDKRRKRCGLIQGV